MKEYVQVGGKKLRLGYTTGSCAAGAALAAGLYLEGHEPSQVRLMTPVGIDLELEVVRPELGAGWASSCIIKDGGDDPDATDGMEICAIVRKREDGQICISGGQGIGVIKKKGLFGQLGEAAINPVPRQMIREALESLSPEGYDVEIFAPRGEEVALKTYNSRLGIEGGISIIGTKGIVYPMSQEAIIKTIYLEIDVALAEYGPESILLVPGNYGEKRASQLGYQFPSVQMSNYVGDALKYAVEKGFKKLYLLGHIGKFAKLALGIFNTHSAYADTRLEAFVYYLFKLGAPRDFILELESLTSAEEAMNYCIDQGYGEVIRRMEKGAEDRIRAYLRADVDVEVRIYSMEGGDEG